MDASTSRRDPVHSRSCERHDDRDDPPDGYPQATTVSFANDGLDIYFGCSEDSQKARNISRNGKVSLTINLPYANWGEIRGISAGGHADRLTDPSEIEHAGRLLLQKFPQGIAEYASGALEGRRVLQGRPESDLRSRLPKGLRPYGSGRQRTRPDACLDSSSVIAFSDVPRRWPGVMPSIKPFDVSVRPDAISIGHGSRGSVRRGAGAMLGSLMDGEETGADAVPTLLHKYKYILN